MVKIDLVSCLQQVRYLRRQGGAQQARARGHAHSRSIFIDTSLPHPESVINLYHTLTVSLVISTTLYLRLLSSLLQVRYLWREWGHNKHVLEDVQKELKLEKTILNALVPKDIVTRLLNGENQIADNFPEATVHLFFFFITLEPRVE